MLMPMLMPIGQKMPKPETRNWLQVSRTRTLAQSAKRGAGDGHEGGDAGEGEEGEVQVEGKGKDEVMSVERNKRPHMGDD